MTEQRDPHLSAPYPLDPQPLAEQDSRYLAQVAVGLGAQLPEDGVRRLIDAGLVRRPPQRLPGAPALELTAQGLAQIRSSDQ